MALRPKAKPLQRQRDQRAEEIRAQYSEVAGSKERLALSQIGERVMGDTRELNPTHVEELAESIEVLGLISPLTIDREGKLLAGGHRRAALTHLSHHAPDRFAELFSEGIPVYRLDLIAEEAPVEALQVEIEENTQRRNYTPDEIRTAALRLEAAGYEKLKGRPRAGQRSLKLALQRIFKLSDRRIQAILNEEAVEIIPTTSLPVTRRALNTSRKRASKALTMLADQLERYPQQTQAQRDALQQLREALDMLSILEEQI